MDWRLRLTPCGSIEARYQTPQIKKIRKRKACGFLLFAFYQKLETPWAFTMPSMRMPALQSGQSWLLVLW